MMEYVEALSIVAKQHGLTPAEVDRALQWGSTHKANRIERELRRPVPVARRATQPRSTHIWCGQCERLVRHEAAADCKSKWCKAKEAA